MLNGLFALLTYVAATALLVWGAVLTQVFPWRSRYEAAGTFGAMFGVGLILLAIAWRSVRRQRVEMSVNAHVVGASRTLSVVMWTLPRGAKDIKRMPRAAESAPTF
jgi:hypothetical protein